MLACSMTNELQIIWLNQVQSGDICAQLYRYQSKRITRIKLMLNSSPMVSSWLEVSR